MNVSAKHPGIGRFTLEDDTLVAFQTKQQLIGAETARMINRKMHEVRYRTQYLVKLAREHRVRLASKEFVTILRSQHNFIAASMDEVERDLDRVLLAGEREVQKTQLDPGV